MVAEQPLSVQCLQQRLVMLQLLCLLRSEGAVPEAYSSPVYKHQVNTGNCGLLANICTHVVRCGSNTYIPAAV
jgi:hypothetical protein